MITIWRILKSGVINFVRNGVLSFASTTIMVLTLLTLSVFFTINVVLNIGITAFQNKIDLSAYLKDSAKEEQILEMQNKIAAMSEVKSVKYVSKNEAMERFKAQNAGNKDLLSSIEGIENPFPASLEVKVYDPQTLDKVTQIFDMPEYKEIVNKVSYKENKAVIDNLLRATEFIKRIGVSATLVFGLIAIIIVYNTIRIAIFSQRDDVEIMKLVGATNWFIRGPFILEGVLYGLIASVISILILSASLYYSGPAINNYFGNIGVNITEYLQKNIPLTFFVQVGIGVFIGITSSLLALRKYLKLR